MLEQTKIDTIFLNNPPSTMKFYHAPIVLSVSNTTDQPQRVVLFGSGKNTSANNYGNDSGVTIRNEDINLTYGKFISPYFQMINNRENVDAYSVFIKLKSGNDISVINGPLYWHTSDLNANYKGGAFAPYRNANYLFPKDVSFREIKMEITSLTELMFDVFSRSEIQIIILSKEQKELWGHKCFGYQLNGHNQKQWDYFFDTERMLSFFSELNAVLNSYKVNLLDGLPENQKKIHFDGLIETYSKFGEKSFNSSLSRYTEDEQNQFKKWLQKNNQNAFEVEKNLGIISIETPKEKVIAKSKSKKKK